MNRKSLPVLKPKSFTEEERSDFFIDVLHQTADGRYLDQKLAFEKYVSEHALQREEQLLAAFQVVKAARCIRHWHDAMRDGSGMVVSAEHVHKLWEALAEFDKQMEA